MKTVFEPDSEQSGFWKSWMPEKVLAIKAAAPCAALGLLMLNLILWHADGSRNIECRALFSVILRSVLV